MRLQKLLVSGFRNLADQTFSPAPRFTVVSGDNGHGKSNLLEAIDYLFRLDSFRGAKAENMIGREAARATLHASLDRSPYPVERSIRLSRTETRVVQQDGKRPSSIASWRRELPIVIFHPGSTSAPEEGPGARRALVDDSLVQMEESFADAVRIYERALRSRNRLLREEESDARSIRAYDELLASSGAIIGSRRMAWIEAIKPDVVRCFQAIGGAGAPGLDIRYAPRTEPTVEALRRALEAGFEMDRARRFTTVGPQHDDVAFDLMHADELATPAKHHASTGQRRAAMLAIKIGELLAIAQRTSHVPLLLLDDVTSELDRSRNARVFGLLSEIGSQVILTTTHPDFIQLRSKDRQDASVIDGLLTTTA